MNLLWTMDEPTIMMMSFLFCRRTVVDSPITYIDSPHEEIIVYDLAHNLFSDWFHLYIAFASTKNWG